jgi:hypothetical protein
MKRQNQSIVSPKKGIKSFGQMKPDRFNSCKPSSKYFKTKISKIPNSLYLPKKSESANLKVSSVQNFAQNHRIFNCVGIS